MKWSADQRAKEITRRAKAEREIKELTLAERRKELVPLATYRRDLLRAAIATRVKFTDAMLTLAQEISIRQKGTVKDIADAKSLAELRLKACLREFRDLELFSPDCPHCGKSIGE